jgi:hypothetical protein
MVIKLNDRMQGNIIALLILFVFGFLWIRNRKLVEENKQLRRNRNDALRLVKTIQENSRFDNQLKEGIQVLLDYYENRNSDIAIELKRVLDLFDDGQFENAIRDLVKIIENILNSKYQDTNDFKDWLKNKQSSFADLINYAKHIKDISDVEHKFLIALKECRNSGSHNLNVVFDDYINAGAFITCIGAIIKIDKVQIGKL